MNALKLLAIGLTCLAAVSGSTATGRRSAHHADGR
jgi:hypothetical protein